EVRKSQPDGAALVTAKRFVAVRKTPSTVALAMTLARNGRALLNSAVRNPSADTRKLNALSTTKVGLRTCATRCPLASSPNTASCIESPATRIDSGAAIASDTMARAGGVGGVPVVSVGYGVPGGTPVGDVERP